MAVPILGTDSSRWHNFNQKKTNQRDRYELGCIDCRRGQNWPHGGRGVGNTAEYSVTIADTNEANLAEVAKLGLKTALVDVTKEDELVAALKDKQAVLSAAPYFLTPAIASGAKKSRHPLFRPHRRC